MKRKWNLFPLKDFVYDRNDYFSLQGHVRIKCVPTYTDAEGRKPSGAFLSISELTHGYTHTLYSACNPEFPVHLEPMVFFRQE